MQEEEPGLAEVSADSIEAAFAEESAIIVEEEAAVVVVSGDDEDDELDFAFLDDTENW